MERTRRCRLGPRNRRPRASISCPARTQQPQPQPQPQPPRRVKSTRKRKLTRKTTPQLQRPPRPARRKATRREQPRFSELCHSTHLGRPQRPQLLPRAAQPALLPMQSKRRPPAANRRLAGFPSPPSVLHLYHHNLFHARFKPHSTSVPGRSPCPWPCSPSPLPSTTFAYCPTAARHVQCRPRVRAQAALHPHTLLAADA